MVAVPNSKVRQARAFLGRKGKIPPRKFAQASSELSSKSGFDVSFNQTMDIIRAMIAAGHGYTPPTQSPIAQQIAQAQASKGK